MTTKLKQLIDASNTAGGRFAHIHGYIDKKGTRSKIVEMRVGASYGYQLQQAITRADMLNEIAMSNKYKIGTVIVQNEIAAKLASWNRSLEGTQKKRADYTTKLGTTKSGIGVIKSDKNDTSIIISGYKLWVKYDEETLPVNDSADGHKRLKRHLDSYVAYRNYTLNPFGAVVNAPDTGIGPVQYGPNFEKVSIQGLTLKPSDIFSMLEELRTAA
jgi:hypothetical protein